MGSKIKLAETKISKQLSAYSLIHYDIDFARNALYMASKIEVEQLNIPADQYTKSHVLAMMSMDAVLKAGGAVATADANVSTIDIMKGALFEAAIVSYARCFNSGLRTSLSKKNIKQRIPSSLKLHEKWLDARNKHIAHSEMKQERSLIGFQMVDDPAYGARPSTVFSNITVRRRYPSNEDLGKLSEHCKLVDEKIVQPQMLEKAKALREQLLKMSEIEIEKMKDFKEAPTQFEPMFS